MPIVAMLPDTLEPLIVETGGCLVGALKRQCLAIAQHGCGIISRDSQSLIFGMVADSSDMYGYP